MLARSAFSALRASCARRSWPIASGRGYTSSSGDGDSKPPGADTGSSSSSSTQSPAAASGDEASSVHTPLISLLDNLGAKAAQSRSTAAAPRTSTRYRDLLAASPLIKGDFVGLSGTGRYGGSVDAGPNMDAENPMHKLVLHVHASSNNTVLSLTDALGRVIVNSSGGAVGFKKAQRAGFEAAYQATASIANTVKERGIDVRKIEIRLKGFGAGREAAFKAVNSLTDWAVCAVSDVTPVPFNGCRPKKARRL
ncbi:hypothetical protein IWQ56_005900 [Coemansia nantahalensis]|uniref:Uncharacterized protein n=2 Tax=Coemansia TaxID=4863 RepID=A0ACC1KTC8_9FUNG|nr:hypothetical protein IWQ56_005900 [Coemansia nantahalensis]KAJ2763502.1 hypothetical protein IWQ57_005550 [Coemansia nantahalensis]KAJ2794721.1 hypothetical protein H4R21_005393 [Coemansia helicoidea]